MRPSLFKVRDIFPIWFSLIFGLAAILIPVLSHLNADSWGERVSLGGWVVAIIASLNFILIFIVFYYQRWKWISKWKYTTKHGIQCFFFDDASLYSLTDVERVTSEMYNRWDSYLARSLDAPISHFSHTALDGLICLFVASGVFKIYTLGYLARLVFGAASGNFIEVGQGGKPIEQTAYIHECSHIYLNRIKGYEVPEEEAHEIFKKVGV